MGRETSTVHSISASQEGKKLTKAKEWLSRVLPKFFEDGGSPAARLWFARFTLARLGLNDGAKLWVSFKLCFKTNDFYSTH